MDSGEERHIVWVFAVLMITIIIASLLFSCRTKTVSTIEYVNIHDTLISVRTDTIRDVRVTTKTDTIKQIESHTFTLNNVGDTVREIHYYHDLWHTMVVDSTNRYEARMDSLERALEVEKDKNKVVVKTKKVVRWWEYVVLLIIVGATIFFVLKRNAKI